MSKHRLNGTSSSGYEWILTPVRDELGDVEVQKLTRQQVDDLVRALREGGTRNPVTGRVRRPWSARSCNYMLGALSQMLEQLVEDGGPVRNVAAHVDRVAGTATKFPTFSAGQVETVLRHISEDRNQHAWHLALSGLRRGEISGLRWQCVDLDAKTVVVSQTRVVAGGVVIEQDDAKSQDSRRTLPLPTPLLSELRAARKRQAAEKLLAGPAYVDSGYVVCDEVGMPYRPDALSKMWVKAIKGATVPRVRLQDARHTCGTLMHLQGVPTAVISAWLGHADNTFTMRTYVHSQPDALAEGAATLAPIVTIRDN